MRTAPRPAHQFLSIAGLLLCAFSVAAGLFACVTAKPENGSVGESAQVEKLQADIQSLQNRLDELKTRYDAQNAASEDTQARAESLAQENRELKANIVRLEALLNDLQTLQLSLMLGPLNGQDVTVRDANPVPTPAFAVPDPTPLPSPALAVEPSPSPSPSVAPSPSPLPSLSPSIAPSPSPSPVVRRPSPAPALSPPPSPAPGADFLRNGPAGNRGDRTEQRPTKLFAETERASTAIFYYHRDAWYDRTGMFIEIVRQGRNQPGATLRILRRTSELPLLYKNAVEKGQNPLPARLSFGNDETAIPGSLSLAAFGIDPVISFEATLDQSAMIKLIRELTKLDPAYMLVPLDGSGTTVPAPDTGAVFGIDDKSRRALFEMISAYRDMLTAPR